MPPQAALDRLGGGVHGHGDANEVGILAGRPVLAIDLDAGEVPGELALAARSLPVITVGVSAAVPDAPDVDVLLTGGTSPPAPWVRVDDLDRSLGELAVAVDASPAAAVILVQLLRLSAGLPIGDGLVAESAAYSLLQGGSVHRAWLGGRPPPDRNSDDEGPAVLLRRDGEHLEITLNRPAVHNAYNAAMRDELVAALQLAGADPTITRVELRGAGPSFSSGGDLREFGTSQDPVLAHLIRTTRSPAVWLARVASHAVAVVHGSCVGAGVELPAFASTVIADPSTTFRLPEVAMGLIPGAGGTVSLPRRIGRQRAAYLAITGRAIDAATAQDWGLVDELRYVAR